mgnify:CR=1 FL=1
MSKESYSSDNITRRNEGLVDGNRKATIAAKRSSTEVANWRKASGAFTHHHVQVTNPHLTTTLEYTCHHQPVHVQEESDQIIYQSTAWMISKILLPLSPFNGITTATYNHCHS